MGYHIMIITFIFCSLSIASDVPPSATPQPQPVAQDKTLIRKELFDIVKKGTVIIKTKAYASVNDSGEQAWSGSGFIVDKKLGLIATNRHVVGEMAVASYEVKFSNGKTTEGRLYYFDPLYDFAFLWVDPSKLPQDSIELELASEALKVNESIYAIGNTAGDEFSVIKGTIFSIYENVGPFAEQSFKYSGLTVGGASGSPVFDRKGKVIGIIYGGKFVSGVALPIRYLKIALEALQQNKYPLRRSLGILPEYFDLDDAVTTDLIPEDKANEYRQLFKEANNKILLINRRMTGAPSFNQFIPGDILWKVKDKMIGPELSLFDEIVNQENDMTVTVYRDGKLVDIKTTSYPLTFTPSLRFVEFAGTTWFENNELIRTLAGDAGPGVYISSVKPTSIFKDLFDTGWFGGNRILKITHLEDQLINSLDDLIKIIPTLMNKKIIDIRFIDFFGERYIGNMLSADRHERFAALKYESQFDQVKVYVFDFKTLLWTVQNLHK